MPRPVWVAPAPPIPKGQTLLSPFLRLHTVLVLVLVLVLSKGTGEIFKKIREPLNLPQTKANQLKLISVQHKLKFLNFQLMKNWI